MVKACSEPPATSIMRATSGSEAVSATAGPASGGSREPGRTPEAADIARQEGDCRRRETASSYRQLQNSGEPNAGMERFSLVTPAPSKPLSVYGSPYFSPGLLLRVAGREGPRPGARQRRCRVEGQSGGGNCESAGL